jgi:hypothetical protein
MPYMTIHGHSMRMHGGGNGTKKRKGHVVKISFRVVNDTVPRTSQTRENGHYLFGNNDMDMFMQHVHDSLTTMSIEVACVTYCKTYIP